MESLTNQSIEGMGMKLQRIMQFKKDQLFLGPKQAVVFFAHHLFWNTPRVSSEAHLKHFFFLVKISWRERWSSLTSSGLQLEKYLWDQDSRQKTSKELFASRRRDQLHAGSSMQNRGDWKCLGAHFFTGQVRFAVLVVETWTCSWTLHCEDAERLEIFLIFWGFRI